MPGSDHHIIFETERLRVRQFRLADSDHFFKMNGDEEIVRYIRPAKSRFESDHFLQEVIDYSAANPLLGRWAVEEREGGEFAGSFAIIPISGRDELQLGYSLLKEKWGRGYATELTLRGIGWFFDVMDRDELFAIAETLNQASINVLLKCGFVKHGENRFEEPQHREISEFKYRKLFLNV